MEIKKEIVKEQVTIRIHLESYNDLSEEQIKNLLAKIDILRNEFIIDFVELVKKLRTIFLSDGIKLDEAYLKVTLDYKDYYNEIEFKDKTLINYKCYGLVDGHINLDMQYLDSKINFAVSDPNVLKSDVDDRKDIESFFTRKLREILKLSRIRTDNLKKEDLSLIEAYKLFYKENLDFKNLDVNEKVHAMLYLLSENNILIAPAEIDMTYAMSHGSETASYINSWLDRIKLNITSLDVSLIDSNFNEAEVAIINWLGNEINQFLNDFPTLERADVLVKFCMSQILLKTQSKQMINPEFIRLERKLKSNNDTKN